MNADHLKMLRQGADVWNAWRRKVSSGANIREPDLFAAELRGADLAGTDLGGADLSNANLSKADLSSADLNQADLCGASLCEANLNRAYLVRADLTASNLSKADLSEAILFAARLVGTDLRGANLTGSRIYGISAWGLKLDEYTKQQNLVVTRDDEPEITVDNIEVAQFVYLLLNNDKIRSVIDTITTKMVLILGRFTPERRAVLDALRNELRQRNYLPMLFDYNKPGARDITETVSLLARMARFVVADLTDAKSIPQELGVIVPDLPSVPVQPLLLEGSDEYGMFEHFRRYPWVLKPHRYSSQEQLIADLSERVIRPAEDKVLELRQPQPNSATVA